jgi:hypothetical protein
MFSVAVRAPPVDGVKVTLIVQLLDGATGEPHEFVWAKSPAWGPVMDTLLIDSATLPEFVTVTGTGALVEPLFCAPKFTVAGFKLTCGTIR